MIRRCLILLMVPLLCMTLVACAGTSAPFKAGAHASGPLIADETVSYVRADRALAPSLATERITAAESLRAATADQKTVEFLTVEAAWNAVKPIYLGYVDADPTLNEFTRPTVRRTALRFEELIVAERTRRAGWLIPQQ